MNKSEILIEISNILKDIFDDENLEIGAKTSSKDIPDWDSLVHIRIIVALCSQFNIELSIEEMTDVNNVGCMVDLVYNKITIK